MGEPDGEQGLVRDNEIARERAQQREQVHDLAFAVPVRQVKRNDAETGELSERGGAGLVRPVAETDEQRSLVEPDQVAALGARGLVEARRHRHARPREIETERFRFAASTRLPGPKQDRAVVCDQRRVVDVDRVGIVLHGRLGQDNLGSGAGKQLAEGFVFVCDPGRLWLGSPAVLAPKPQVTGLRRAQ